MGGRYFITGVQIGMIKALVKQENESGINKLMDEIEKKQCLGEKEKFKR